MLPICARPPKTTDGSSSAKGLQVAVVDLRGEAGRAERVEADVLIEVEREAIWADGAVEGDKHLALLGVADTLDCSDQPGALRHKKLLMVVGVIVGRQHDQDRTSSSPPSIWFVTTPFKDRALEDAIEPSLIGVEVVSSHRIAFAVRPRLVGRS